MKEVIDVEFSKEQIKFMHGIGISIDFTKPLQESAYEAIEEKVALHLQKAGFDQDYKPTKDGIMCESILDML